MTAAREIITNQGRPGQAPDRAMTRDMRGYARHSRRIYRPGSAAPRPVWSSYYDAFRRASPAETARAASADAISEARPQLQSPARPRKA